VLLLRQLVAVLRNAGIIVRAVCVRVSRRLFRTAVIDVLLVVLILLLVIFLLILNLELELLLAFVPLGCRCVHILVILLLEQEVTFLARWLVIGELVCKGLLRSHVTIHRNWVLPEVRLHHIMRCLLMIAGRVTDCPTRRVPVGVMMMLVAHVRLTMAETHRIRSLLLLLRLIFMV